MKPSNVVLAITGASGVIYAVRLLDVLLAAGCQVHLTISPSAKIVLKQELDLSIDLQNFAAEPLLASGAAWLASVSEAGQKPAAAKLAASPARANQLVYHHYENLMAPIASGSFLTAGMVVCPCSGSTLGAIVHGTGENLIHRAAQVHLKERRKLIVVPRETPLSTIQLDNMARASQAGAVVLPAMPGFYHGVKSIRDLVDFVVARICDQLGVDNALIERWGE